MKKIRGIIIWVIVISIWLTVGFWHAQEAVAPALLESDVRTCPEYTMNIVGSTVTKKGILYTYSVESTVPAWEVATIIHEFRSWPDLIESYEASSVSHTFEEQKEYLLKTLLTTHAWCTYVAQETIKTYENFFLYIWPWSDEYDLIKNSLKQPETFLGSVTLEWDVLQQKDKVVTLLIDNKSLIESADVLLVDSQALWVVLWALPDVERIVPLTLDNANVYVLSFINQSAFRRLVATYHSIVWLKEINVVSQNNVSSLVSALLLDKNPEELWLVKKFTTDTLWSNRRMVISYLVDELLVYGIPLQMIVLLLLIPLIALIITFYRQVVWFTTYGIFVSMLLWLTIHILWIWPMLILLCVWWLSVLTWTMITQRVYVLSTSKVALNVTIYTIFLIMIFVIQYKYWIVLFDVDQLSNGYIVFPMFYVLIASLSIFRESASLFKKKWFIWLFQWAIVIATVLLILRSNTLHNILLWYPELILAFLLCIFLVWRYTWLQWTEYLRFFPLITWSLNDQEEEE